MDLLLNLLAGIAVAGGVVLLPGMLNMTTLKTSVQCGKREALLFAGGVVTVIAAQASLGIIGANYLGINQNFIDDVKVYAIPVFLGLAAFFFYRGYQKHYGDEEDQEEEKIDPDANHYVRGLTLSAMNMLAIPFYYALGIWIFGGGHLTPSLWGKALFIVGIVIGCFALLTGYTYGAPWIKKHAKPITANLNFILGALITLGVSIHAFRTFLAG